MDLPAIGLNLRRNTKIILPYHEERINIFTALEPINENIDYTKGDEMPPGSAGTCFYALNNNSGKVIIVKTLDFSELTKEAISERHDYIEKNIEQVKEVQCSNIINYLAVVQNETKIDIVMEYVPGGSLKFILNNFVKFKEKLVRSYTKQILEGLKVLHEQGICHGDLKTNNILIDDLGIVKLSDFSFLKRAFNNTSKVACLKKFMNFKEETKEDDFETQNLPLIGSEWYTPPEVVRDSNSFLSPAYDIWQLGWIIVEMLTGKQPWPEQDGDAKTLLKMLKITEAYPKISSAISDDCRKFLKLWFKINPEERVTAQELLEEPFLAMTPKEFKESLEASNFISFFSIIASQKSITEQGKNLLK